MESFFDRLVVLHFSHTNGTGVVFAVEPYLQDNECVGQSNHSAVSYTHLTLPTIYSV